MQMNFKLFLRSSERMIVMFLIIVVFVFILVISEYPPSHWKSLKGLAYQVKVEQELPPVTSSCKSIIRFPNPLACPNWQFYLDSVVESAVPAVSDRTSLELLWQHLEASDVCSRHLSQGKIYIKDK